MKKADEKAVPEPPLPKGDVTKPDDSKRPESQ